MIRFRVLGEWHPDRRPRFNRSTGTTYTDAEVRAYKDRVRGCFLAQCRRLGLYPSEGSPVFREHQPVTVWLTFYRPLPESRPKRIVSEPDSYKPDVDNLAKAVLDALNGIAWKDDGQVVALHSVKADRARGYSPQVFIEIAGGNPGLLEDDRKDEDQ